MKKLSFESDNLFWDRFKAGFHSFYGKYDSQRAVSKFKTLRFKPLLSSGPYYCAKCAAVVTERECSHGQRFAEEVSGTSVRSYLSKGRPIPEWLMHREVSELLRRSWYKSNRNQT